MSTIVPGGPQPEDAIDEAFAGALLTTSSYRKSECRYRSGVSLGETDFRPGVWLETL
jgi:hypothetical protein